MKKNNISSKPVRFAVHHLHEWHGGKEEAWVSYNTELDAFFPTSALNMARHTATRYHGEILADYGDGAFQPYESHIKKEKQVV